MRIKEYSDFSVSKGGVKSHTSPDGFWGAYFRLDQNVRDLFPFINATKSMIGHCLGAGGAIETIGAVLELTGGFLHPSLNCEDLHPEIAPYADKVVREYMALPGLTTIAKASFGFGDVNSCLIMRKWQRE